MLSPEDRPDPVEDEDVEPFELYTEDETEQGDDTEGAERQDQRDDQYTMNSPEADDTPVLVDVETEEEASYPLSESEDIDFVSQETNEEAVMSQIEDFTEDEEILDDFEERQHMNTGSHQLHDRLRSHHAETPELAGGDVDAAWDQSEVGDHLVGGEPTPDRDNVDEIGEGAGLTYEDDEPLDFAGKVWRRDEERWELDPESAEDDLDDLDEED